jgi:AcrR family transcriptional regulator
MREMTIPESGSKRKLLDAAELLFAEKGFEAVSVRDITQLAKANVAAVNYHFGSRDNLLALVMMRYMTPVTEERIVRLDDLEQEWRGKPVPLEELIEAMVRPLVGQVKKSDLAERLFYKLTGRICAEQGNGLPPQIEDQFRQVGDRFSKAIAKSLPSVPVEELAWRIHFLIGAMIHMLTHQELLQRVTSGASGAPTMEVTLARFIKFAAAGLREGTGGGASEPEIGFEEMGQGFGEFEEPEEQFEVPKERYEEQAPEERLEEPEPEAEEPEPEAEEAEEQFEEPEVAEVLSEEAEVVMDEVEVQAEEPEAAFEEAEEHFEEPEAEAEEPEEAEEAVEESAPVVEKPVKVSPQITFDF